MVKLGLMAMTDPVAIQRKYYEQTAAAYDETHVSEADEHHVALGWLASIIKMQKFDSLLDVGCGTGRGLRFLKANAISIKMTGIEPVSSLRQVGLNSGLTGSEIMDGDALAIPFPDRSFDVVCAFAILHHIKDHRRVVREMCRVARRAVFISDANNFGQGSLLSRTAKQALNACGLWPLYNLIRTKGKGYQISEGDGLFYSYSLTNDLPILQERFSDLQFMTTKPSGVNLYRSAPHFAVMATGPLSEHPINGGDVSVD